MASEKIRLGVIGANSHMGWAPRSHLPAIVASPEFELTAVCTTRRESAEESQKNYGARLAFDNYQEMLAHPDIDAVAVVLRVPSHYEPTIAALNAGKHVYTEWPLGQTTAEAPGDGGPGSGPGSADHGGAAGPARPRPSCTCETWSTRASWERLCPAT